MDSVVLRASMYLVQSESERGNEIKRLKTVLLLKHGT